MVPSDLKKYIDNSLIVALHKLNHHMYNKHNELLAKHNLTVQQSRIIRIILIEREFGAVNQKDIEKHLNLKGSSVSSLIKNMIEKGFLLKTKNPTDGRYYNLNLTKKGEELDKIIFDIFYNYNLSLSQNMTDEELEQFKKYLNIIDKNIKA